MTHLSAVLRHRERFDEAVSLAREVRNGWKELEREAKVQRNTLTATNILAELLHTTGKNEEAEPICREVLNGFLRAVGPQHPFSVSAVENLSNVLRMVGKADEADKLVKQFGLKTPLPGGIEEGDEGEEEGGPPKPKANGTSDKKAASPKASPKTSPKKKSKEAVGAPHAEAT